MHWSVLLSKGVVDCLPFPRARVDIQGLLSLAILWKSEKHLKITAVCKQIYLPTSMYIIHIKPDPLLEKKTSLNDMVTIS